MRPFTSHSLSPFPDDHKEQSNCLGTSMALNCFSKEEISRSGNNENTQSFETAIIV
jgi:hypothetical protein